jgi:hypothetical protein
MTARSGTARDILAGPDQGVSVLTVNTCFGAVAEQAEEPASETSVRDNSGAAVLSVRAQNVLKLLAADMTGESPSKDWLPSASFLQAVTFERLAKARNCGPLTIVEIIGWANSRGVAITPPFHAGKSLSETWRCLEAKFTAGELSETDLIEALQWSVRRRSVNIPLGIQRILMKLLSRAGRGSRRP